MPIRYVELDTSWHWVHWLPTGSGSGLRGPLPDRANPLTFLVPGGFGTEVRRAPVGTNLLVPEEVRSVAQALGPMVEETARERFDQTRIRKMDLYPTMHEPIAPGEWDAWFPQYWCLILMLKRVFAVAARREQAVVVMMS